MKKNIVKKKQLKINKKNTSNLIIKEDPEIIQKLIFEDVKNINKFNILIEEIIINLQNGDLKIVQKYFKSVFDVLDFFLIKNSNNISQDLITFFEEKIKMISNVLVDSIDLDDESDTILRIINYLIQILTFSKNEDFNVIFKNLSNSFILNEELVDPSKIQNFSQTLAKHKKFFEPFLLAFNENLNSKLETSEINLNEEILYNIFNFLMTIPKFPHDKPELKMCYQNILINLINHNKLPEILLKNILLNLNKIIFDNVENPLIMSDYLINIYEKSSTKEFDLKVLSLSGLFVLITKYKLDYSNYYNILYKTISLKDYTEEFVKTVFDSKYRNRIFKIIELSLKSPNVPIIVILSFIKKLARVCLLTTSNNISIILGIIQNLIKSHPRSIILLHRVNKKVVSQNKENNENKEVDVNKMKEIKENSRFNWDKFENKVKENSEANVKSDGEMGVNQIVDNQTGNLGKYEQFDDEQIDPYKTKAHLSCLWEFTTLKNHFSFKIRNLVGKFERNFLKLKEFDMNSVANLKEDDMLYEVNEGSTFYVTPLNRYSLANITEDKLAVDCLDKKILNII